MRESLPTEAQIILILESAEVWRMVLDLCREHGVTQATLYRWRSKVRRIGGTLGLASAEACAGKK